MSLPSILVPPEVIETAVSRHTDTADSLDSLHPVGLDLYHERPGLLGMANDGPDSNGPWA